EVLARNRSYHNNNVKLYELIRVYRDRGGQLPEERVILTLGAYGNTDFFAVKGAVESILRDFKVKDISFSANTEAYAYHPGRCADIWSGDKKIGIMGQIHPKVAENWNLGETYTAELDFYDMLENRRS
ncbi:MAG: phenylalanine--tRNA ligase subunit beta, partial [Oscillospiraceae bacterium]|nr:phenylalanine--tRNA ligase subunit beta [Oscillospiraceae bacterium]